MNESRIGEEKFREIVKEALSELEPQKLDSTIPIEEPENWKELQVKVAEIYRNLGCEVEEEVQIGGGKTKHRVDVLATFEFGGQKYRIVIECKYWNSKVKKSQVSSFIGVLADIGAEKGIIVSKMGFQRGAHKLAAYTNIELLTFNQLRQKSALFIDRFKIHNAFDRIRSLRNPFLRFFWRMKEEASKKDLWWYPSAEGDNFRGALSILQSRIEQIDLETFPRRYYFSFISKKKRKDEIHKRARNRREYLDLILENLAILEKEYEEFKDKIFSE